MVLVENPATIGIDTYIDEAVFDGEKYKFKIFDTAGAQRYKNITKNSMKFSDGFIIIFSVIDRESFEKVNEWMDSIKDIFNISDKTNFLTILLLFYSIVNLFIIIMIWKKLTIYDFNRK